MKILYLHILIIGLFLFSCTERKDGFVQESKLYTGFEMTRELNKKLEATILAKNQILDSLKFSIKQLELQLNANKTDELFKQYELKKQEFLYKNQQFNEENQQLQQTYTEQSLIQINEYINKYGEMNDYDYIYGANGNGSLMYAKDKNDITEEVLVFINKKYQGK